MDIHERFAQGPQAEMPDPFISLKHGGCELYFIRHGDALPDADEVVGGGYDEQGLSALGRSQAKALGQRLQTTPFAAIYSSPIGRAWQTATYVAEPQGLNTQLDPELREVTIGPIGPAASTSMTREEASLWLKERLNEIANFALYVGIWSQIAGSEPSVALRARITRAAQRLAALHAGQRIAVVSHGGVINAYFAEMLGITRDYFFPAANTSISVARVNGQRSVPLALNDVAHLRDAGLLRIE